MLAVAAALAVLLALVVAALAVPVVLVFDAERVETLHARWRVRWLFGLVDVRSARERPAVPEPERPGAAKPARTPARRRKRGARMAIAVLRTRGLLRRVGRLAVALGRQVKLEQFHLRTAFGFDDPADTGIVYGCLSPWLVMASVRGWNVECRPMFLESGLRGTAGGTVQVRPLSVAGALVAFLLSPPVVRAARSAWRARK
jgi:hypothetical protein